MKEIGIRPALRHCEERSDAAILMTEGYYVYIMSNHTNTTLYTGVTNNLERRVIEHRTYNKRAFTSRYKCRKLVYAEWYSSNEEAIAREKQIKSWSRWRKDALIDAVNPGREDLMGEIATSLRSSQ